MTDTLGNPLPAITGDVAADLELKKKREPKVFEPNRALLWAIIPGGGQVYNRRWWKVPLVFGGFTGMLAVLDFNSANYDRFRTAYVAELAGEPHEFEGTTVDGENNLRIFRDRFNQGRQSAYFYLLGMYALQGVEAYVDAHLRNFDIDEDLSAWHIQPLILPDPLGERAVFALHAQYTF